MRRNWLTILLFTLALAIQAIAPVAANLAHASGAPVGAGEICVRDLGAADAPRRSPGPLRAHDSACLFCQAYCDGAAPLNARAAYFGRAPVRWVALAWTAADRALPTRATDYSRQARAPPSHS